MNKLGPVSSPLPAPPALADVLSPDCYVAPEVFAAEQERLFGARWQFAALASELAGNHDFVTLDLPGHAVVVQNFKGTLKAFQNICSHRFNRIQTEPRGRRPLLCGYHGWSFGADGFPVGRPNRDQYPAETPEQRSRLCLPEYPVARCGAFVFVDLSGNAPPLREELGQFHDELEALSSQFGPALSFSEIDHRANWKLLVENVLECYHCATVHPDTFVASLGVGRGRLEQLALERGSSSCHFPRQDIPREHLRRKILAHLDQRGFAHNSLFHLYVFPNLFVSSQEGLTFYVGQAIPLEPDRTILRTRVLGPKVTLSDNQRVRQDMLDAQSREMAGRVIEEDRLILEAIQRNMAIARKPGIIGAEEIRISAFFDRYRAEMNA